MPQRLQGLVWRSRWLPGLAGALARWSGTPYMKGARVPGVGVDCARFASEVLNEVFDWPDRRVPNYAADPGVTNARESFKIMKRFLAAYPELDSVQGCVAKPGDLVVLGPMNGGPYHVTVVGPGRGTIWTADQRGVTCTGFLPLNPSFERVFGIYRVDRPSSARQG